MMRTKQKTEPLLGPMLSKMRACIGATEWARNQTSLFNAWRDCPRGDWLLWIAVCLGVDRKAVVFAACQCAREALKFVRDGEERPRIAIETTEAWTRGEATLDEVRVARSAAYAADDGDTNADDAAAAAAYVAAAAYTISAAEVMAAVAIATVDAADTTGDSRQEMQGVTAHVVRKHIPWRSWREALKRRGTEPGDHVVEF